MTWELAALVILVSAVTSLVVWRIGRRLFSIRAALTPTQWQRRRAWKRYHRWAEAQEKKGKPL